MPVPGTSAPPPNEDGPPGPIEDQQPGIPTPPLEEGQQTPTPPEEPGLVPHPEPPLAPVTEDDAPAPVHAMDDPEPPVPEQAPNEPITDPMSYGFNEDQTTRLQSILNSDPRFTNLGVIIDVRPTDPVANRLLLEGERIDESQNLTGPDGTPIEPGTVVPALPKSELLKWKTTNNADLSLGARPEDFGKVWAPEPDVHLFPPDKDDPTLTRDNPDANDLWGRYDQRVQEYSDQQHQRDVLHQPFDERTGTEHDWQMIDGERVRVRTFTDSNGVERILEVKDQSGNVRSVLPQAFAGDKDLFAIRKSDGTMLGARPRGSDGQFLTRDQIPDEQWSQYRDELATKASLLRALRSDPSLHNMHADLMSWDTKGNPVYDGIANKIVDSHLWNATNPGQPGIRFQAGAPTPTQWYSQRTWYGKPL
jgi:hypothetical protein